MKIGLLIKGNSKRSSTIQQLVSLLKQQDYVVISKTTSSATDHVDLLDQLLQEDINILIACGGDGTLHQCVNAILSGQLNEQIKLAHFPMGTANDFARSIQLNDDVITFVKRIQANNFKKIDAGEITFTDIKKHYFINIADAGIGGEIILRINKGNKNMGGVTYAFAIIKGLLTFKRKEVDIQFDSGNYKGKLLSVVIANGKYFANGLHIAPHADLQNGKFAITLFGDVTLYDYFRNIKRIKKGEFITHPKIKYLESTHVRISSNEKIYHLEADGEYLGTTPLEAKVIPSCLSFLC